MNPPPSRKNKKKCVICNKRVAWMREHIKRNHPSGKTLNSSRKQECPVCHKKVIYLNEHTEYNHGDGKRKASIEAARERAKEKKSIPIYSTLTSSEIAAQ